MHAINTYLLQDCFVSDEIVFYIYMSSMMIITFSFLLSLQQYLYNCAKFSGPKSAQKLEKIGIKTNEGK